MLGTDTAFDLLLLEAPVAKPTYMMPLALSRAPIGTVVYWEGYVAREGPEGWITGYHPVIYKGPVADYRHGLLEAR
ncbi:MAG: hypothetical protein V3W06_04775, partial [Acidimicrobiia bacterium]